MVQHERGSGDNRPGDGCAYRYCTGHDDYILLPWIGLRRGCGCNRERTAGSNSWPVEHLCREHHLLQQHAIGRHMECSMPGCGNHIIRRLAHSDRSRYMYNSIYVINRMLAQYGCYRKFAAVGNHGYYQCVCGRNDDVIVHPGRWHMDSKQW